ncbi:MAG: 50S ribosomal protein L21 [Candidatus Nomurabacteria bacterium]|jgi:large subunit ribosomal protein L21|nr:50S ribosomal protein L21 [Candidatus Nomurabacteria bacterium]
MKAVIVSGGKQYLVAEGEKVQVDLIDGAKAGDKLDFAPLMLVDGDKSKVGTPEVAGAKVSAKIVEPEIKGDKVRYIRYKSKKRVHTEGGHRQRYSVIEITAIK